MLPCAGGRTEGPVGREEQASGEEDGGCAGCGTRARRAQRSLGDQGPQDQCVAEKGKLYEVLEMIYVDNARGVSNFE